MWSNMMGLKNNRKFWGNCKNGLFLVCSFFLSCKNWTCVFKVQFVLCVLTSEYLFVQRVVKPTRWGHTNDCVSLSNDTRHMIVCRASMLWWNNEHNMLISNGAPLACALSRSKRCTRGQNLIRHITQWRTNFVLAMQSQRCNLFLRCASVAERDSVKQRAPPNRDG